MRHFLGRNRACGAGADLTQEIRLDHGQQSLAGIQQHVIGGRAIGLQRVASLRRNACAHHIEPPFAELPARPRDNRGFPAGARHKGAAQCLDGRRHVQEFGNVTFG